MNNEKDQAIDMSALDPTRDNARFETLVSNIMHDAAPGLEARRSTNNVVGELANWRRPVLAAAAAASAFLVFSFSGVARSDTSAESNIGIAEAIGVPTEFAAWMRGETQPTVADIYEGLSGQ